MPENKVVVVFTAKSSDRILREGGTSSWRLDRNNARQCEFAVCTRNANANWVEGPEEHHSAFLVGKVKDVVPSLRHKGRFLVQFSEYAVVNVPEIWKGDRNPLKYAVSLQDLGIDAAKLRWERMPKRRKSPRKAQDPAAPLALAEAKKRLALTFGVSTEAIEITIRA